MRMQPWNLVFLAGFVTYAGIRHVFEQRTRSNETALSRKDGRDRVLIAVVALGSLLLPALYLFTPWLGFATLGPQRLRSLCNFFKTLRINLILVTFLTPRHVAH